MEEKKFEKGDRVLFRWKEDFYWKNRTKGGGREATCTPHTKEFEAKGEFVSYRGTKMAVIKIYKEDGQARERAVHLKQIFPDKSTPPT